MPPLAPPPKSRSPFLEQVRAAIRVRHYSIRTEQSYVGWVIRFIRFHGNQHPREMGDAEVAAFLSLGQTPRRTGTGDRSQRRNAAYLASLTASGDGSSGASGAAGPRSGTSSVSAGSLKGGTLRALEPTPGRSCHNG